MEEPRKVVPEVDSSESEFPSQNDGHTKVTD